MLPPHSLLAVAATLSLANAAVVPFQQRQAVAPLKLTPFSAKAFQAATPDRRTHKYATLQRNLSGKSRSSSVLRYVHRANGATPSAPLDNTSGVQYLVPIQWGTQKFNSILDSGSSDTWLVSSNFKCVDQSGQLQDQSKCNFGPTFQGGFGSSQIQGVNFNVSYGDGEFVTGDMGYQDVTIGGITVKKQEVALGTSAYWEGSGDASGLVGLAYPAITSAFEGSDPSSDSSRTDYDPVFTSMYKQKLSAPTFSLALMRGQQGGYIAFGGLPPVSVNSTFAKTAIQTSNLQGASQGSVFSFYAMTPDSIVSGSGNGTSSNTEQYIVDSGTTLTYLPADLAKSLNAAFSPPATQEQGAYVADCSAKPPQFGVTIGGTTFYADAQDLLQTDQPQGGKCVTAFQDGGSGPFILGDAWMKSVVVVFDVGASEMRFVHHDY